MHYVRLKPGHLLTQEEKDLVTINELSTPEERWPLDTVEKATEVFFKGTEFECVEFIQHIGIAKAGLSEQFEAFEAKE